MPITFDNSSEKLKSTLDALKDAGIQLETIKKIHITYDFVGDMIKPNILVEFK
jgi:hypothetical protein